MSTPTADRIEILLPELPCRIGVLPGENLRTQPVRVELTVELDLRAAAEQARIEATLDYAALHAAVRRRVLAERWTLVEALAGAVLDDALADARVTRARVTVEKCRPPRGGATGPCT